MLRSVVRGLAASYLGSHAALFLCRFAVMQLGHWLFPAS